MGYEFRPSSSVDTKKIGIGIIAVLFIFILYSMGTVFTGYTTYTKQIEADLNSTREDLRVISAAREDCAAELGEKTALSSECSGKLSTASADLDKCKADLSGRESSLNECRNEISDLKASQSSMSTGYKNLVKNSVKAICCTISDVDSGSIRNWRIENDKIICGGNFTVNCATGETNYS